MADYYPLLARALDALPDRSPALRKAVYDRARSALIGQLRSLDPPVAEADIDLESEALDKAIERLEADFGGPAPAPKPAPTPAPASVQKAEPKPPVPQTPSPEAGTGTSAPNAKAPPSPPPPPKPEPAEEARPVETPRKPAPEPAPPPPADPVPPLPEPSAPEALPEAGPPTDFVPFVPPPRKPRPDAALSVPPAEGEAPPESDEAAIPPPEPGARRPRIDVVKPRTGRSKLLRNAAVGGMLVVVIGLIAVAAFMLRDKPAALTQGGAADAPQGEQADSKFNDRVGGGGEPEPRAPSGEQPQQDLTVAQHAILYDENVQDPRATPKATQGRVVWRLEPVNGEQGQPLQSAVRATIEYPDAHFWLMLTIRKNLDATLPASHTIELAFTGQGDERTVQEIGLPQLKDEQNGRGALLSGLPVRVRDNLFLIGLSNLPGDIERNTDLLTKKNWIDLPVRFKSGPRAVLAFDKGAAGNQVVQQAFDQWKQ